MKLYSTPGITSRLTVNFHSKKPMNKIVWIITLLVLSKFLPAQKKIACIGNSITAAGYPSCLNDMLGKDWEVKNFGVSGSTMLRSGDLPYHTTTEYTKAKEYNPDVIIIKLGTNDSKPHNWKFANDFEKDYSAMIQELQALPSRPRIFICYPVPAYSGGWGINDTIIKNQVIPKIKKLAQQHQVQLIDLYKPLRHRAACFPDGIHPNEEGSRAIAKLIAKTLKKWEQKTSIQTGKLTDTPPGWQTKNEMAGASCSICGFYIQGHRTAGINPGSTNFVSEGMPVYCNCFFGIIRLR